MKFKLCSSLIASLFVSLSLVVMSPTEMFGKSPKILDRTTPRSSEPGDNLEGKNQCLDGGISEWFLQERILFLSGEITSALAESIAAQLMYLDAQTPGKDIYLYINSEGGDVTAGMAIIDVMRSLRSDVVTVSLGEASSMASFLLASGTKGKRFLLANTRVMIHQPWRPMRGPYSASDLQIEAKEILYFRGKLNRMLAALTGQPLKRIETDTDRDFYMSAEEAKAYGLVDHVVTRLPSASNPGGE